MIAAAPLQFARVDGILRQATGRLFTGAVARIEAGGRLLFEAAYGSTRNDRKQRPVFVDTAFDLASLTKIFISTAALQAVDQRILALDRPLLPFVPEWAGRPHERITLRMLLAHMSGMNSGADYRTLTGENVEAFALARELAAQPGERMIYSDLGMIALGVVLQRAHYASLPAVVARAFPGMRLRYVPFERDRGGIPATEEDAWRGRVQGSVHDEKAHLLCGVAGHAGLFGSAADVAGLTRAYLAAEIGRPQAMLSNGLAREACAEQAGDPILRRGLGWALKTNDDNSCGRLFSRRSFGHTGFTGTCVWADPSRDLQAVLLTNTLYFGRSDSRPLRAAFYEAVAQAADAA
jgi:serine-type D-Ala-D-Ala carboxypeptidase